ncbi:hypothetical protein QQY24_27145 [Streptomyces sp. TG1A-8]|uniref:hypothetical protein n=1 Tax=Streptomyces sp. TG1A-8 TaxID=3051385 RepID=UPI00265C122F|nr:hypothetical protein [Streptomyces sp. TG1A-8]MDO0928909.1 hypothetical protein [Streptomyces sp. TG1A-8]
MTGPRRPLPATRPAGASDLRRLREHRRLLQEAVPRVREAALAWRNGLAALLAALVGFGLVKGRSDIGQLTDRWAAAVGLLLLAALVCGALGAMQLLLAAHGRPRALDLPSALPRPLLEQREAADAARQLRRGIALTLLCTALLVAAVGATWYGPAEENGLMRFDTPGAKVCGTVRRVSGGEAVVRTGDGEVVVPLATLLAMAPVSDCPKG